MATNKELLQLESMLKARISADKKNLQGLESIRGNTKYTRIYSEIIAKQEELLTAIQA